MTDEATYHHYWSVESRYDYHAIDHYIYPIEYYQAAVDPAAHISEPWMQLASGPVFISADKTVTEQVAEVINNAYWAGVGSGFVVQQTLEDHA